MSRTAVPASRRWPALGAWSLVLVAMAFGVTAGCGGGDGDDGEADKTSGAAGAAADRHGDGAAVRRPDPRGLASYPVPVRVAPATGRRYDRTTKEALEHIVAKLEGTTTREAWQAAKEFFWRAPEEAIQPLVDATNLALVAPAKRTHLENLVEAMGRMGNPELAPVLLRCLDHSDSAVRSKAIKSLIRSGTADAVRDAGSLLPAMGVKERVSWLEACRVHLGEEAVGIYRAIYYSDRTPAALRDAVLEQCKLMPPERAVAVVGDAWTTAGPMEKLHIAGIRHTADDLGGTRHLQEQLEAPDPNVVSQAIAFLMKGSLELVADDLMELTFHADPLVRLAATDAIAAGVEGENGTNALMVMVEDPAREVAVAALRALASRGERTELERRYARLATATGAELTNLLEMIPSVGDAGCGPVLIERFLADPPRGRRFLQALAYTRNPNALPYLRDLFLGDELVVEASDRPGETKTTINYLPRLMVNLRGAEFDLVGMFRDLPPAKDGLDLARRAWLLDCLGQVAADREDEEVDQLVYGEMRELLFDRDELPAVRLQSLDLLRRDLGLGDAARLRLALDQEQPAMAQALSDFLFEQF